MYIQKVKINIFDNGGNKSVMTKEITRTDEIIPSS